MKYYDYGLNDPKLFICKYKIKGDNIVVYYASGKKKKIAYTYKNEQLLLERMENQVNNIDSEELQSYLEENNSRSKRFYLSIMIPVFVVNVILYLIHSGLVIDLNNIAFLGITQAILASCMFSEIHYNDKMLDDFRKNKLYVDNEDLFERVKNMELSSNLINIQSNNLNINNIDELSYQELSGIVINANKELTRSRIRKGDK